MSEENQDARVVRGYCFVGEDDAQLASQEEKKIAYLEKHMDYNMPDTVLQIYQKSIDERIFKTPVGYEYLKSIQQYLLASEEIRNEDIPPIRLFVSFQPRMRQATQPARNRVQPPEPRRKVLLPVSLLLNLVLLIAVGAMFVIALKSDQPNILNYETAITNKYSEWEQELTQREKVVREKERELKIEANE
ncbi:MAG: hypothetical protein HDR26_10190 [Lachnospiraceae bacterium]|nr:hypothetical protein [Lachnospiraceae bacterium]